MFGHREALVNDVLVVMFLFSICTMVYGGIKKDPIIIGIGAALLFLFIFHLWIIKGFRKR